MALAFLVAAASDATAVNTILTLVVVGTPVAVPKALVSDVLVTVGADEKLLETSTLAPNF